MKPFEKIGTGILFSLMSFTVHAETDEAVLIGKNTAWRHYIVQSTEEMRLPSGEIVPVSISGGRRSAPKVKQHASVSRSELPADNWMQPEFDDSGWPLRLLPTRTGRNRAISLLCLRNRFFVENPKAAGPIKLSVAYRGGVMVYVNGKEVKRSDMPESEVTSKTSATDYPKEAYLDPDGHLLRLGWGDPGKYRDRFELRNRALTDFIIPVSALQAGVNVLALSVHRPPTDEILYKGKPVKYNWRFCPWETLNIKKVSLRAPVGTQTHPQTQGLIPLNLLSADPLPAKARPNIWARFKPIRVSGARNGFFSAQVVIASMEPIKNLQVANEAEAILVRYPRGEALHETPPEKVPVDPETKLAMQRLWITVNVPPETAPGLHRGVLTVSADNVDALTLPIELSVADWTLPNSGVFETFFDLVQSPESLAIKYEVEQWSPEHWKLVDRSFELMGQVGSRVLYVPIIRESHFGNKHSMVRWIKKADGTWDHDFSIFEKYLDTAIRRLGKLHMVGVHAWGAYSGGSYFGKGKRADENQPFRYSLIDPATGKLTAAEGPSWDDPDCVDFLKPVFDGIRSRLEDRGLANTMMIGSGHDRVASPAALAVLKKASGGVPWVVHCHPHRTNISGQPIGYLAYVWGTKGPTLNPKYRAYGWREKDLVVTFPRAGSGTIGKVFDHSPLMQYRMMRETAICTALKGFGWMGADFWHVIKNRRKTVTLLDYYYGYDQRTNLGMGHAVYRLLAPGPDGPLATTRLEMAREGGQEAEARVFIERVLHDPRRKAKLGADLAEECQSKLDKRLKLIIRSRSNWLLAACNGYEREYKQTLYALAAKVKAALKE